LRPHYKGLIIANCGFNGETGLKKIQEGTCDGVSFARFHITNPDLAERLINNYPLNSNFDFGTFYGTHLEDKGKGYIDYPPHKKA